MVGLARRYCFCEFDTHRLSHPFADVTLEDSERQQGCHARTQKAEVTYVVHKQLDDRRFTKKDPWFVWEINTH